MFPRAAVALLLGSWTLSSGSAATAQQQFRASTSMVLLDVSVAGPGGRAIRGLDAEDFIVLEDGVEQPLSFFEALTEAGVAPASVVLLLDASSSVEGSLMARSQEAALGFIEHKPPDAEVAVAGFDDDFHLVSDFTEDAQRLAAAVRRMEAGGGTGLYDAVIASVRLLDRAKHGRQVIVLWTDGADLDSDADFGALETALASSPASLYAVGQYTESARKLYLTGEKYFKRPAFDENLNPVWVLRRLAELSGGQAFFPGSTEAPAPLFEEIAQTLQRQYVVGYQPSGDDESEAPRFHEIEVRLRRGSVARGPVQIRTRRGYVR